MKLKGFKSRRRARKAFSSPSNAVVFEGLEPRLMLSASYLDTGLLSPISEQPEDELVPVTNIMVAANEAQAEQAIGEEGIQMDDSLEPVLRIDLGYEEDEVSSEQDSDGAPITPNLEQDEGEGMTAAQVTDGSGSITENSMFISECSAGWPEQSMESEQNSEEAVSAPHFDDTAEQLTETLLAANPPPVLTENVSYATEAQPFIFNLSAGLTDVKLHLSEDNVQVLDAAGGVWGEQLLLATSEVIVNGSDWIDDTLTVELADNQEGVLISYHGGNGGFDSLVICSGKLTSASYAASGPDSGTIILDETVIYYTGLEPITDYTVVDDRVFTITTSGVDQQIRIGDDGAPDNGYSTIDSNGTGGFESITFPNPANSLTVFAGDGNDMIILDSPDNGFAASLIIDGQVGNDTFIGPDSDCTWDITGINLGRTAGAMFTDVMFTDIENLTGGLGSDIFVFADGSGISGVIDGGGGTNTLDYSNCTRDVAVNLDAGAATGTGGVINIQNVIGGAGDDTLIGNAAANSLIGGQGKDILTGGLGSDTLDGREGKDTLMETRDADFILTDAALTINLEGTDALFGIEQAILTGGASQNTLDASGFSGSLTFAGSEDDDTLIVGLGTNSFAGGPGNDTLTAGDWANLWEITGQDSGKLNGDVFTGVESLNGGAAADTFVILVAVAIISKLINGRSGDDELKSNNGVNLWAITSENAGMLNGQAFVNIEILTGGADTDVFVFAEGSSISGVIDGGSGYDTLDYSAYTADVVVNLGAGTSTATGGINNIENLIGGGGYDTVEVQGIYNNEVTLNYTGSDSGSIELDGAIIFSYSKMEAILVTSSGRGPPATVTMNLLMAASDEFTLRDQGTPENVLINIYNTNNTFSDTTFEAPTDSLIINSGPGNDTITVELLEPNFDLLINGEGGNDTLIGPDTDCIWNITGTDSGEVCGINFTGIENLTGGTDNEDTFIFSDGGSLSGTVEGGAGGFDSLILDGGNFNTVAFDTTGPDSGRINRDGNIITYSGLEPVYDTTDASNKTFNSPGFTPFTSGNDVITVSDYDGVDVTYVSGYSQIEPTGGETVIFKHPTSTLTLNSLSGLDNITINQLDANFNADLTINAGDGNDDITVNAVTGSGTYTINGEGDTGGDGDTIILTRNDDITLTDILLTVGSPVTESITLIDIESAELTGGGGDNILDASSFTHPAILDGAGGHDTLKGGTGNDTLIGGTGDDTYFFADNWGTDTLTENPGEGTDTLDFTAVADALTTLKVNGTKTQITSGANVLNQANPAEKINVNLSATLKTAINNYLAQLTTFSDNLAQNLDELKNRLPLITRELEDAGFANLLGLTDVFSEFQSDTETILNSSTNLIQFVDGLIANTFSIPALGILGVGLANVTVDYRGQTGTQNLEVLIGLDLIAQKKKDYALDLGENADVYGVTLPSPPNIRVQTDLTANLDFVITTATPSVALADADLVFTIEGSAALAAFDANLGFLGVQIGPGTVGFDGRITINVNDPNGNGYITGSELISPTILTMLDVNVTDPDGDPPFSFSLPVAVNETSLSEATKTALGGATLNMSIPDGIFSGKAPTITVSNGTANLLDFGNISAVEALSMLAQIKDTFAAIAKSELLSTEIPYSGKTVGELLDFATVYKKKLDSLFASGDMLIPDINNDQVPDLTFSNIQQMAQQLGVTANYNPANKELTFDLNINKILGFGSASVVTILNGSDTPTNEIQRLTINAIPTPAVPEINDTYRLAFLDSSGVLEFTAPIAYNAKAPAIKSALQALASINNVTVRNVLVETITEGGGGKNEVQQVTLLGPNSGTFTLTFGANTTAPIAYNASAAAVKSALEALASIGAGNVSVVEATDGGNTIYTITFQGAKANTDVGLMTANGNLLGGSVFDIEFKGSLAATNVELLRSDATDLQGKYSFGFGDTLGDDIAKIEATNTINILATLSASLTFGINLEANSTVEITPPVFKPDNVVSISTELPPGASYAGNYTVQILKIDNANDGKFILFKSDPAGWQTDPIDFNADTTTIKDEIEDEIPQTVTVSQITTSDTKDRYYQITFSSDPGYQIGAMSNPADPLKGMSDNGILSSAAHFKVNVFVEPAIGVYTVLDGKAGTNEKQEFTILNAVGGTFTLSFNDKDNKTIDLAYDALAIDVQSALEDLDGIGEDNVTVSKVGNTYTVIFQGALDETNVSQLVADSSLLEGSATPVSTFNVTVPADTNNTSLQDLAADVDAQIGSPLINVDAGGGRISLSSPSFTQSYSTLRPSVLVDRRIEIYADFEDPAYQEMGILSAPTRYDGKLQFLDGSIGYDIKFNLIINGNSVPVVVTLNAATANPLISNFNDLITQLQTAVNSALDAHPDFAADDVIVYRIGADIGAKGNRIGLRGKAGVVTTLAIDVPEDIDDVTAGIQPNGAIYHLGFESGEGQTQRSKATEFFVENVNLNATLSAALNVAATASFGFLGVEITGSGTMSGSASFALKDPVNADNRITFNPEDASNSEAASVVNALSQGKFRFVLAEAGGTVEEPGTGPVDGTLSTDVDLSLTIAPSGALSGIGGSASIAIGFHIPDWLTHTPTAEDIDVVFSGPNLDDLFNRFTDISFDDIIKGLQYVLQFLQGLNIEALDFDLPLINKSISELVSIAAEYSDKINAIISDPSDTLQELQDALNSRLEGLGLSFNIADGVLRFDLTFSRDVSKSLPFNLDLSSVLTGDLSFLSSLVGASASGNLNVGAGIDFNLAMGLDLSDPDDPDFGTFFLFPGAGETGLTANASVSGSNLGFSARLGPFNVSVIGGSASLDGEITIEMVDADGTADGRVILFSPGGGVTLPSIDCFNVNITGSGEADMPLYVGTEDNPIPIGSPNSFQVVIDDLLKLINDPTDIVAVSPPGQPDPDPLPSILIRLPNLDLFQNPPALFDLLANPATLVGGLDQFLRVIQDALNGQVLGVKLPFLGDVLDDNPAANFIGDLRNNILTPLVQTIRESNLNLEGLIHLIEDKLQEALDYLESLPDLFEVSDIVVSGYDQATNPDAHYVQYDFTLSNTIEISTDVAFDIGLPFLGLALDIEPTVTIEWSLDFGVGIDESLGFYFVTSNENELELTITVDLGSTEGSPASAQGRLGFLALTITDGIDIDGNLVVENDEFSKVYLDGGVDIKEPSGDGKLTFSEIMAGSSSFSDIVQPNISGGANLFLHAVVDFAAIDPSLATVLPSVFTDFILVWDTTWALGQPLKFGAPSIGLSDITLDLGSFISDFAGPILDGIKEVLDPLEWLIGPDGLLLMRLPLISDLAGTKITVNDLIGIFDPEHAPYVDAFLEAVQVLYFLIDLVGDASGTNVGLNFGDLIITDPDGNFAPGGDYASFFDNPLDFNLPDVSNPNTPKLKDINLNDFTLPDMVEEGEQSETTSTFTAGVTKEGSLQFDILKPENIFKLILGMPDVTLFTYELPELSFDFFYRQEFPIWGPVVAFFGGGFSAKLDFGFGYDTRGINQFMITKNPINLINGFFLSDIDFDTGYDRPEVTFTAEIAAGAGLSLALIKVGIEGGIRATILFNLSDLDDDGKVRFDEMFANIVANSGNPLAIFDVSGLMELFLRVFIEINLFITTLEFEYEFLTLKLFEFDIPFERPAIVASVSGEGDDTTLTLNIGPSAANRLKGDTSDTSEKIFVSGDSTTMYVWSEQFNRSQLTAMEFNGVKKIVAYGGAGDDWIDLTGVTDSSITAEIHGGDGNDTIKGGAEADTFYGDAGNDFLWGGSGNDILYGGTGNDELHGEGDGDTLYGQDGNDKLYGNAGSDSLDGGKGDDDMYGGAGDGVKDTFAMLAAGSDDEIFDGGSTDVLDFTDFGQNVTFVFKNGTFFAGWGAVSGDPLIKTSYEHTVSGSLADIAVAKGGILDDVFHIFETSATGLTFDGQQGSDKYIIYGANPAGPVPTMEGTITDTGNPWDEDLIKVLGTTGDDKIEVTNSNIKFLFGGPVQTVTYVPPTDNPIDSLMNIKVFGFAGNDKITIESTAQTVPVRVEAGSGNDLITVGGSTVDGILGTILPNTGLGPLVLLGGTGHDSVIIDDSGDSSNNVGNITTFLEKRMGVPELVEVGVVSGLDMNLKMIDENGASYDTAGRVEFEGFEAVDVQLGTGDDTFTIGGGFNLDKSSPDGGKSNPELLVNTEFPKNRLAEDLEDPTSYGIKSIVNTIKGMTIVSSGAGDDIINVIATQNLDTLAFDRDDLNALMGLLTVTTIQPGVLGFQNEQQKVTVSEAANGVGYFTLQYRYAETRPIPVGASAEDVRKALVALVTIGQDGGNDNVLVNKVGNEYIITFQYGLGKLADEDVPPLEARIIPLTIIGDADTDRINVQNIDETTFIMAGSEDDFVKVNVDIVKEGHALPFPTDLDQLTVNGVNATVTLDGQDGSDFYDVYLIGKDTDSLINVFDTGTSGSDKLTIYGVDNTIDPDIFLIRASSSQLGLAFVARLNHDLPENDDGDPTNDPVERINYNQAISQIEIRSAAGDDEFYSDGTRAKFTIFSGEGNDFFQIGQLYKTRRTTSANVKLEDIFTTIETTRGWLSDGVNDPMTINSEGGEDLFIVFHNLETLTLNGGDDNDTFIIQAFALAGSQEDKRAMTDLSGDAGADTIMYAVNAPVNINGGDGLDTIIIIGTEFGDDFVVTKDGVFGAGLNINFINIEYLEVDGAEGDDRFFIQSTGLEFVTRVVGSLGTDFFFVNGPTPRNGVISNDLLGHSGIITHTVTSSDTSSEFEGAKVEGISTNVADNDEPAIIITETDGFSQVIEGVTDWESYTIALSRPPLLDQLVRVDIAPPKGLVFEDPDNPGTEKRGPGPEFYAQGIQLDFDVTNWYKPQTVRFHFDDNVHGSAEVLDLVDIQHSIKLYKIVGYDPVTLEPILETTILGGSVNSSANVDPDPAVIGDEYGTLTANVANIFDGFEPPLYPEGLRGSIVDIVGSLDDTGETIGQRRLILFNTDNELTVNSPWTVLPKNGDTFQILTFEGIAVPNVRVELFRSDIPAIVVQQVDGPTTDSSPVTTVAEGTGDSGADYIGVRLSADPLGQVRVDLMSTLYGSTDVGIDGQLRFFDGPTEISELLFDSVNYNTFQTIKVVAFNDDVVEGFHKVDLVLTATQLSGGSVDINYTDVDFLTVADIADDEAPQVRILQSDDSTNIIEFTDGQFGVTEAMADAEGFPRQDTYQVVLTKAPASGETVTVHILSEPTRTSRTGGIRSYTEQLEVSSDGSTWGLTASLSFNEGNWDQPQTVYVRAIDDSRVDGGDTKVFAPKLDQVNSIQGPLFILGGQGQDKTGLLEREPIMLPYETNIKDNLGNVVNATEAEFDVNGNIIVPATITIDPTKDDPAEFDLLDYFGVFSVEELTKEDLVNMTIEITEGTAKNKVRIITDAEIVDSNTINLTLNHEWNSPFPPPGDNSVPEGPGGEKPSKYTVYETNPNFLVKEVEQADRLIINDTDNINDYDDPALDVIVGSDVDNQFAVGQLFYDTQFTFPGDPEPIPLNRLRFTGFGMGADRNIGGILQPGGITIEEIEQLIINLGPGNDKLSIDDDSSAVPLEDRTPAPFTTVNAGDGDDVVNVKAISGHTIVNLEAGDDVINITNDSQTLESILGLLTVTGDIPKVTVETLAKGSPAEISDITIVDAYRQIAITATGGTFTLTYDGQTTPVLHHNARVDDVLATLEDLNNIEQGEIVVIKKDRTYFVHFTGDLAGTEGLLTADGSGLIGTGASATVSTLNAAVVASILSQAGTFKLVFDGESTMPISFDASAGLVQTELETLPNIGIGEVNVTKLGNVYRIELSGAIAGKEDKLTIDNTGLSMPSVNAVNEIQQIKVDGTGGIFTLSIGGQITGPLAYNISAVDLQQALQDLVELAFGVSDTIPDAEVTKAGNIYRITFVDELAGGDIALLAANESGLTNGLGASDIMNIDDSLFENPTTGVLTSSSLTGLSFQKTNEIQTIVLNATQGTLSLSYDGQSTCPLSYDISADQLRMVLEGLSNIEKGDVAVSRNDDVIVIRFQGNLANMDVPQIVAENIDLMRTTDTLAVPGGQVILVAGNVEVFTRVQGGQSGPVNDMQVLTIDATSGTYRLRLQNTDDGSNPGVMTDPIPFDATAEVIRDALQRAIARGDDFEALKFDVSVDKFENVYIIGFQGKLRTIKDGAGVDLLEVVDSTLAGGSGAQVAARMDGINYYGFELININLSNAAQIFDVQGSTAGSGGFYRGTDGIVGTADDGIAVTNINMNGGDEQIFVSSNADLDFDSAPGFDFLTGELNDVNGSLNLDVGIGRHKLMISDEATTIGDNELGVSVDGTSIVITDTVGNVPGGATNRGLVTDAEIWITGLAGHPDMFPEGGISYKANDANGDFFDGIIYWTGSGDDKVTIEGTHLRPGERTTTMLNTGLGDDIVTVDLDTGEDGFFVLNTMGGVESPDPADSLGLTVGSLPGDDDTVDASASTLPLTIFGGIGDDEITSGSGNDFIFGDFGRVRYFDALGEVIAVHGFGGRGDVISSQVVDAKLLFSVDRTIGAKDIIRGSGGEDVLIGGCDDDRIDGNEDRDIIFGDNVSLDRRGELYLDYTNPRFRVLDADGYIYDKSDDSVKVTGVDQLPPLVGHMFHPVWADWDITFLDHSATVEQAPENRFGSDYIAGGPDDDTIFGQLGDDVIQGDGSIDELDIDAGASRAEDGTLTLHPSFEDETDGDDYIEGNGGNDVIFGNLGQDDIIGGNSSLFSLVTPELRPDGTDVDDPDADNLGRRNDIIFGGAGTDVARNEVGDADIVEGEVVVDENGHSRDADMILGDNGNIYRLVSTNGVTSSYLTFGYDNYTGSLRIIPRAAELLDYTVGGPDYLPTAAQSEDDIGAVDEIHGESGDDFIYGMVGSDILFGEGQDDDIIGGYGFEWISGGAGQDGVLGDDGRIYTSRNGTAEPLYDIGDLASELDKFIYTPGKIQQSTINVSGALKKTVNLTPFKLGDPNDLDYAHELSEPSYADDIIYGGWGGDFLHAGDGDDAVSGAEALAEFYEAPANLGNVLGHNPTTGEFAAYDEYDPWRKILVDENGVFTTDGSGSEFLLNFDHEDVNSEGQMPLDTYAPDFGYERVMTDGDDVIFGDLGNDWLVGGTGKDHLYSGYGCDLLNVDDNHDSTIATADPRANDIPDTHPSYEDIAYGGAGRDVLIANTGGDRLIDWVGEFNSYIVPFAPFGMATVSRTLQPQLREYLYDLSESDGADPTRAADTGADPARNGEPEGELGVVKQQDLDWHDQTGAPDDPQAGNIPGGKRDVLRSATFNDGTMQGFFADSGVWHVESGALRVSAESRGGDAVSVFHVDEFLPSYFEIMATISTDKPTGGWKANAYIIFDYYSPTDFKFAGLNASIDKMQMGHRTPEGWIVDVQQNMQIKPNQFYNMLLAVNGTNVTLLVNGSEVFTHTFAARVIDGYSYGLNTGMVGFGSDNSKGIFDNIAVQILPPLITFELDGVASFTPQAGMWRNNDARCQGTPGVDDAALSTLSLNVAPASLVELNATIYTRSSGGLLFDYYGPDDFKFVAILSDSNQVVIGHRTTKGWFYDVMVDRTIDVGNPYQLTISLIGTTVSMSLDGQVLLSYAFNSLVNDGDIGLLSKDGASTFYDVLVKGDDPSYQDGGANLMAAVAPSEPIESQEYLTYDDLSPIVDEAIDRWSDSLIFDDSTLAVLDSVAFQISDLPGLTLGRVVDNTVLIDVTAAGYGWFIDSTPFDDDDMEFGVQRNNNELLATYDSEAFRAMDLLTVVMHEIGHVLGLEDLDAEQYPHNLMSSTLDAGVRRLIPVFDTGMSLPLDWQAMHGSSLFNSPLNNGGLRLLKRKGADYSDDVSALLEAGAISLKDYISSYLLPWYCLL